MVGGDHDAAKLHLMFGRGEGIGPGQVVAIGRPLPRAANYEVKL